ncbi:MAG: bacillithiol biosynthesis protein BshC, partial [Bacteroidia bacterium]
MAFTAHAIRPEISGQFSALFLDYLAQHEKLNSFYAAAPHAAGYAQAITTLRYEEENRSIVCAAIREQYVDAGLQFPEKLLHLMEQSETLTVTTGHQLCLLTGPLYFVTKIASTIRLAETLSQTHGRSIVPVYWMASEDHDVEEIRALRVYG